MKLVMIGHGMVGHKFIESVLEHAGDEVEITILAEEPRLAYDRVHLTEYFSGKSAKDLTLCRSDFADAYGIDLRLNTKATEDIFTIDIDIQLTVFKICFRCTDSHDIAYI